MILRRIPPFVVDRHILGLKSLATSMRSQPRHPLLLSDDFYDRLYLHTLLVCQYIIICILLADLYLSMVYILLIYTSQQHLSLSIAS